MDFLKIRIKTSQVPTINPKMYLRIKQNKHNTFKYNNLNNKFNSNKLNSSQQLKIIKTLIKILITIKMISNNFSSRNKNNKMKNKSHYLF